MLLDIHGSEWTAINDFKSGQQISTLNPEMRRVWKKSPEIPIAVSAPKTAAPVEGRRNPSAGRGTNVSTCGHAGMTLFAIQ
jgi:hypothetical protein